MFVGWDWASASHDVTVVDDCGIVIDHWAFQHSEDDFAAAFARLSGHGTPAELPVTIERSSGLVADRLLEAGQPVVPVHPTAFHAARPPGGASGANSDPDDSYKLAACLRTDGHRLRRLTPVDSGLRELQALVRLRDDHVRARTAAGNQLGALLEQHSPGPKNLFCPVFSDIALNFLTDYPTPQSAARLGEARTAAFCKRHAYRGGKPASALRARLRSAPIAPVSLPTDVLTALITAQVQLLRGLRATNTHLEKAIKNRLATHPRALLSPSCPAWAPSTLRSCSPRSAPSWTASSPPNRPSPRRSRAGSQGIREVARCLLPVSRRHTCAQSHHCLRSQLPHAVTLGRRPLCKRPRNTQPSRHPDRRPRMTPGDMGLLAQRHPLYPSSPPALQPPNASHPPDLTQRTQTLRGAGDLPGAGAEDGSAMTHSKARARDFAPCAAFDRGGSPSSARSRSETSTIRAKAGGSR